jgi:predicted nucleic acid-binding protein
MILVDTSVWIAHLAGRPAAHDLRDLLLADEVACHPTVRGEVALGNLAHRSQLLTLLEHLPPAPSIPDDKVLTFIERQKLHGTGVGWVDAHLLASVLHAGLGLWTLDKRLAQVADRLTIATR